MPNNSSAAATPPILIVNDIKKTLMMAITHDEQQQHWMALANYLKCMEQISSFVQAEMKTCSTNQQHVLSDQSIQLIKYSEQSMERIASLSAMFNKESTHNSINNSTTTTSTTATTTVNTSPSSSFNSNNSKTSSSPPSSTSSTNNIPTKKPPTISPTNSGSKLPNHSLAHASKPLFPQSNASTTVPPPTTSVTSPSSSTSHTSPNTPSSSGANQTATNHTTKQDVSKTVSLNLHQIRILNKIATNEKKGI